MEWQQKGPGHWVLSGPGVYVKATGMRVEVGAEAAQALAVTLSRWHWETAAKEKMKRVLPKWRKAASHHEKIVHNVSKGRLKMPPFPREMVRELNKVPDTLC